MHQISDKKWHIRSVKLFAVAAAVRVFIALFFRITPQEAYYWEFARHPAPGYFDHPSVTPWTIWIFTKTFGTNVFGIRFGAIIYGIGALLFLWLLARKLWDERTAFWVVLTALCVPLFNTAGMFFTPDPPLVFFWLGGIYFLLSAIENKSWKFWILSGLFGGMAMLSKYTAAFWFAGAFLFLLLHPDGRKFFKTPKPYAALFVSILAFSPEIIWNAQHDWASFTYQSTRRAGEIKRFRLDYFFGYIGAQFFAASPVLFVGIWWKSLLSGICLLKSIFTKIAHELAPEKIIVASFSLPMMLFFSTVGLIYWVKLNWLIPAYFFPIAVFVAWSVAKGKKWHIGGLSIAGGTTIIILFVMLAPFLPVTGEMASTTGWWELAERIQIERAEMDKNTFIFGGEYKVPAMLAYYLPDKPETAGPDIIGRSGFQFAYWVEIDSLIGRDAIFVIDPRWGFSREHGERLIEEYFDSFERCSDLEIIQAGKKVTTFYIYRCYKYHGIED